MSSRANTSTRFAERDSGDREIRQEFVAVTSMGIMVVSYLALMRGLSDIRQYRLPLLVFALLFTSFFVCYQRRSRNEFLVGGVYLLIPALSVFVLLRYAQLPYAAYAATLCAIAAFQISRPLGIGSLALNTLALALGRLELLTLLTSLGLLWGAATIEFASTSGRLTVLRWALNDQVRDSQGELNRTLEALTEATRRLQRTNAELRIARQDAEEARSTKEQFVANVSHELRTPLNLIIGFAEMMYLHPETYEGAVWGNDLESDVREIYRASRHLQELVNDVLDLSRIDAMRLPMFREMQQIEPIVLDVIETMLPLYRQRDIALSVKSDESIRDQLFFVDRTRIRQVLINVLGNALRYTDEGSVTVELSRTDEAAHVCVSDTGVGIPADKLSAIFEEFRQADPSPRGRGGAGLGLALSRRFVELHGGRMWADSVVGQGTSVRFEIPLPGSSPSAGSLRRAPDAALKAAHAGPVVVVDADPTIRDMLHRYLDDRRVIWAPTIDAAVSLIEPEHPAGIVVNQSPEAPISTWFAPPPRDLERYNVPLVQCSIPSPSWLRSAVGLHDCLTKPVSPDDLARALAIHCPRPGTVLVVDDDPGFVMLVERMLGVVAPAYTVIPTHSGLQALKMARSRKPDVVLLDLAMPEMDGFDLLRELRQDASLEKVPVIAVTASSYAEEALHQRGAHLFITQSRGVTAEALLSILRVTLDTARPDYVQE
jgi:signal transduction histidine kinase/CheY-like chemotaxis protein